MSILELEAQRYKEDLEILGFGERQINTFGRHTYVVARMPRGHLCGYIKVPSGLTINREDIKVHGGVTFGPGDIKHLIGPEGGGNWIGFDTSHAQDYDPGDDEWRENFLGNMLDDITYKDVDYVTMECLEVIQQLEEIQEAKKK